MTEEAVLPELRLRVYEIDPDHVDAEFIARCGGKLMQVCIFDPTRHHHCCEITPSYAMHNLYLVAGKYPEDEEALNALSEELMEVAAEDDSDTDFVHCRHIKLDQHEVLRTVTQEQWDELLDEHDGDKDAAYDAWFESMVEYYNCNHPY